MARFNLVNISPVKRYKFEGSLSDFEYLDIDLADGNELLVEYEIDSTSCEPNRFAVVTDIHNYKVSVVYKILTHAPQNLFIIPPQAYTFQHPLLDEDYYFRKFIIESCTTAINFRNRT